MIVVLSERDNIKSFPMLMLGVNMGALKTKKGPELCAPWQRKCTGDKAKTLGSFHYVLSYDSKLLLPVVLM
jgi:hypothetical protein